MFRERERDSASFRCLLTLITGRLLNSCLFPMKRGATEREKRDQRDEEDEK